MAAPMQTTSPPGTSAHQASRTYPVSNRIGSLLLGTTLFMVGAIGFLVVFDAIIFPQLIAQEKGRAVQGVPRLSRLIPLWRMEVHDEAGDIDPDTPSELWKHASGEYADLSFKTRSALKELDLALYADTMGSAEQAMTAMDNLEKQLREFHVAAHVEPRQQLQVWALEISDRWAGVMRKAGLPVPQDFVPSKSGRVHYTPEQRQLFDPEQRPRLVQVRDHLFFDFRGQYAKVERMAKASDHLVETAGVELDKFRGKVISLINSADWNGREVRARQHQLSTDASSEIEWEEADLKRRKELARDIVGACQQSRRAFLLLALAWCDTAPEDRIYRSEAVMQSPFEAAKSDAALTRFIATQYIALRITEQAVDSTLFDGDDKNMRDLRETVRLYSKHMRGRLEHVGEWVDQGSQIDGLLAAKIDLSPSRLVASE